jgi:hypothetical protein
MVEEYASYPDEVDPLRVEIDIADLLTQPDDVDDVEATDVVLRTLIPEMLLRPSRGALTLLLGSSRLLDGPVSRAARLAAAGLTAEGIERPAWVDAMERHLTVSNGMRVRDENGVLSLLGADVHRGDWDYSVFVAVNHRRGHCAERAIVLPGAGQVRALLAGMTPTAPVLMVEEEITPSEFRTSVQKALDRPALHQGDDDDDDVPSDSACALVLRAWLRSPVSGAIGAE